MLEENIWKLKQDLEGIRAAAQVPVKLMQRFEQIVGTLEAAETLLTPTQKQAVLSRLTTQMQAIQTAVDTARDTFLATEPIERPTEEI